MSNDILFLAEFSGGAAGAIGARAGHRRRRAGRASRAGRPSRLAYGPGAAAGAAALGAHGASARRRPRRRGARPPSATPRPPLPRCASRGARRSSRRPRRTAATSPRPWSVAWACPPSARCAPPASWTARSRPSRPPSRGSVITTSRPADGAPTPSVVLVLANTFTPAEGGSGTADVDARARCRGIGRSPRRPSPRATRPRRASSTSRRRRSSWPADAGSAARTASGRCASWRPRWAARWAPSRAAADAGLDPVPAPDRPDRQGREAVALHRLPASAARSSIGSACRPPSTCIAINRDPDAPIGEFADLFVVGDLFAIVPALTEEIRRRKGA